MKERVGRSLVIGGGAAGMESALRIGEAGHRVVLIEKETQLGGNLLHLHRSFPLMEDPAELVKDRAARLRRCPQVEVMTETVVRSCSQEEQGYSVQLVTSGKDEAAVSVHAPAVVIATGFDLFDSGVYGEYGYGIYRGVMTGLEFEDQIKRWVSGEEPQDPAPRSVAFFKCVGSRDRVKGHQYCSKICCMYTAKQARLVKELFPESKCFVFYMDYRAAGKGYEEFVRSTIEDKQVRYVRGRPSKVLTSNDRLLVRAEDTLMGVPIEVEADMVVLATAMVPRSETLELAELFGCRTDDYGFLEADHDDPVKCGERVFFAGAAGFALSISEAQTQGAAAAASVLGLLSGVTKGVA